MTRHQNSGQLNHQTVDPKANASVFLFFSITHFLKTILASRTKHTFIFLPTHKLNAEKSEKVFSPTLYKILIFFINGDYHSQQIAL